MDSKEEKGKNGRRMISHVQIRASKKFVENLNKIYPDVGSIRAKTEKLNKILEKIIYENK